MAQLATDPIPALVEAGETERPLLHAVLLRDGLHPQTFVPALPWFEEVDQLAYSG